MKYRLEFGADDVEVIRAALYEMKCKDAIGTFNRLDAQVHQQNAAYRQAALNQQVSRAVAAQQQQEASRGKRGRRMAPDVKPGA